MIKKRHLTDKKYIEITKDIFENECFQKMEEYEHHDSTILEHVISVSVLSYDIARLLHLDYRAAARGGLLHDFFLYNWRTKRIVRNGKKILHGFIHPEIALDNAEGEFSLTKIERDIILKHMWPLTIPPPRYLESFIVNFADTFVSLRESTRMLSKALFDRH
ncbi:MAG: hypothetical protein ACLFR1_00205 [Spirochaetia bacterium]